MRVTVNVIATTCLQHVSQWQKEESCSQWQEKKSARNDNLRCNIQNVNKGGIPNVIIKI